MIDFVYATHSGLYFVRVSDDFQLVESKQINDGYHYGITTKFSFSENCTTVLAYRGGPNVHEQTSRQLVQYKIKGTEVAESCRFGLGDESGHVHQLAFGLSGSVLVANTAGNSIDLWHDSRLVGRHAFGGHSTDVNHVNSIYSCGDVIAVLLHNLRRRESQIAVMGVEGFCLREQGRFSLPDVQCHNLGTLGHYLFYNASGSRSLVKMDLRDLRVRRRVKVREHTKGLSSDGHMLFSGMSNYAARSERGTSSAWLLVIDPSTMEVKVTVPLLDPVRGEKVGNINEIRLVGQTDVFDPGDPMAADLFTKSLNVRQSRAKIELRRTWIRSVEPLRRSVRSWVSR